MKFPGFATFLHGFWNIKPAGTLHFAWCCSQLAMMLSRACAKTWAHMGGAWKACWNELAASHTFVFDA